MERRVDATDAKTHFGEIMDRAIDKKERFIVDRRGHPAVVIMSVEDFINAVAPAPEWLRTAWTHAKTRGLDALSMEDIDAEINAARKSKPRRKGK